jgi:hypothetical protein
VGRGNDWRSIRNMQFLLLDLKRKRKGRAKKGGGEGREKKNK